MNFEQQEANETGERAQTTGTSQSIAAALHSGDHSRREAAARSAEELFATLNRIQEKKRSVEETIALLRQEINNARRHRRRRIALGSLLILLVFSPLVAGHHFWNLWWVWNLVGGSWLADKAVGRRREAARALGRAGDPRAVGVLALALRDGDAGTRDTAADALLALLPRVRASDAGFLTTDQMDALLALGNDDRTTMRSALLQALEQIGDARAIPLVERLQTDPNATVRERARQCLPFLETRARQERERNMLLRASDATGIAAPDQLLRAASADGTTETPPDQLLRAGGPQQ